MNDIIALLVVASAFAGAILFHAHEASAWRVERANLLDRLMARTYQEFVYATKPDVTEPERPQMTTDAAEAAYAQEQESLDLAWHERNQREHPELYPDGIEAVA